MSTKPEGVMRSMGILFSFVGVVCLGVGAVAGERSWRQQRESLRAPGVVVALAESCDSDGCTYRPIVEYTVDGQARRIEGSVGSRPPAFSVGEAVQVMYPAGAPGDASIDSWSENWFLTALMLGMGTVFGGIGIPFLVLTVMRSRRAAWARELGTRVSTRFVEVRQARIEVNGRTPWRIVSEWDNPRDGKRHRFESEMLWTDPSPHLKAGQPIGVMVDLERPRHYWMDTGFLPKAG
jgi:hypothetical protein